MITNARIVHCDSYEDAYKEIKKVGSCEHGAKAMADKAVHVLLRLDMVPTVAANIIKQEMLSKGGEAAVSKGTVDLADSHTSILLMGTIKQYKLLTGKLKLQQFKLPTIAKEIEETLAQRERTLPALKMNDQDFHWDRQTYIMGILNVTPDSFSDGGLFIDPDKAIIRAREMVHDGADIIDIGAESSRPGHNKLSLQEEEKRLFPALEKVLQEVKVPVSIDTTKAYIAKRALKMGASMINDISFLKDDPALIRAVAQKKAALVIMHNREKAEYIDLMGEIMGDIRDGIDRALDAGVNKDKIIVDPGIGFGKTAVHNLIVLQHLKEIKSLGFPLLVGPSRKSFIGKTLDLPVQERVEGTAAAVSLSIAGGADFVRVHDVKAMRRVADMSDAIVRHQEEL